MIFNPTSKAAKSDKKPDEQYLLDLIGIWIRCSIDMASIQEMAAFRISVTLYLFENVRGVKHGGPSQS